MESKKVENNTNMESGSRVVMPVVWNSIKDKLPENYGDVLLVYNGISLIENKSSKQGMDIGYYEKAAKTWHYKDDDKIIHCVTHWMLLPSLPEQV